MNRIARVLLSPAGVVSLAKALTLATGIWLIVAANAHGAGPRRWFYGTGPWTHRNHYGSYRLQYRQLNDYYPKYYDGFHARYFESLGLPSGDRGPRGNGLYATPW
jgi:hypothetical protein